MPGFASWRRRAATRMLRDDIRRSAAPFQYRRTRPVSRLDSVIRRLKAQRICLNWAAGAVASMPGPALELGLGNGRTYDHMRERMPDREIFVFEREVNAHPDCIPDSGHLFLGDILETLPRAVERLGRAAVLAHSDIGTGDEARNARLAARVAPFLTALIRPGGLIISDRRFPEGGWEEIPPPDEVPPDRYFIYRVGG